MQNSLGPLREPFAVGKSQDRNKGKSSYDRILCQAQRLVVLISRARPDSRSGTVLYPGLPPIEGAESIAFDDTVWPVAWAQSVKDKRLTTPRTRHITTVESSIPSVDF